MSQAAVFDGTGRARLLLDWWRSLDRTVLGLIAGLLTAGLILSMAASPAAAARVDASDPFYYLARHVVFASVSVGVMLAVSSLSETGARRLAILALGLGVLALFATLLVGHEVKGARRWLRFAGLSLQPSEFVKPALVVTAAWLFAAGRVKDGPPGAAMAFALLAAVCALLIAQPDVGQTLLVAGAVGATAFLAGLSWRRVGLLAGLGLAGLVAAYRVFPHVADRINQFIDPSSHDTYQVDRAREAIARGGLIGAGPGEGAVKDILPDSHTDFVFAVGAEEYGLVFALGLIALFGALVTRVLARSQRLRSDTARLAAGGLGVLIGLQALINLSVNLGVVPPKGMTLPFVSYGGSSLVALGFTAGLLLAFTRARPGAFRARDEDLSQPKGARP